MDYTKIFPLLCQKNGLSYILFSKDFSIIEFSQNVIPLANEPQNVSVQTDIREAFWEFIGIEEDLFDLAEKIQTSLKIPMIYKNNIYYDIEIELIPDDAGGSLFLAHILQKSNNSLKYIKSLQEINKQTLISQNGELSAKKDASYYELLNKQLITFHVNEEGIITKANEVCCYFFGLRETDIIGHHFSSFFQSRESNIQNSNNKILNATNTLGEEVFFSAGIIPLTHGDSSFENIFICQDVSALKRIKKELEFASQHDSLTGLTNRTRFLKKIDEAIKKAKKNNTLFYICFLDICNFQSINESYGHHAADMTLKHIASHLQEFVREFDTVARVGGDRFAILFNNMEDATRLDSLHKRLQKLSEKNPLLYTREDTISYKFHFGWSVYSQDEINAKNLLESAQRDMYKRKKELH